METPMVPQTGSRRDYRQLAPAPGAVDHDRGPTPVQQREEALSAGMAR